MAEPRSGGKPHIRGVKETLLMGVFWRILVIEAILLAWSLFYRWYWMDGNGWDLFWYAVRIIALVGVILAFMMLTLRSFLSRKVIKPLEAITYANRVLGELGAEPIGFRIPPDTPAEIQNIVETRAEMLSTIYRVGEERQRLTEFIRKTFGRYVSEQVVNEILDKPEGRRLGGERKEVTVMLTDLRGYTRLSEERPAQELVELLNRYFDRMSRVINRYGGIIDDFYGDGMLVVFGAITPRSEDPAQAVACALHMQLELEKLNREIAGEGHPPLEMGIGVHSGPVIVGNIGSELRMKYAIVGFTVNLASRIESDTVGGQVLISGSTYELVKDMAKVGEPRQVTMKGVSEPVTVHPVLGMGEPYDLELLPADPGPSRKLDLDLSLWLLRDNKILEPPIAGRALGADSQFILARLEKPLEPGSQVKLKLMGGGSGHAFGDIYAKVVSLGQCPEHPQHQLRITGISPDDWRTLQGDSGKGVA